MSEGDTDEVVTPSLVRTSHTVTLAYRQADEDVTFSFNGMWEGRVVTFEVHATRTGTRYNGAWPRWRKWHTSMGKAHYGFVAADLESRNRGDLDDTARVALYELVADRVLAEVQDPDFYEPSAQRAYRRLIQQNLRNMTMTTTFAVLVAADSYVKHGLLSTADGKVVVEAVELFEAFFAKLAALSDTQ